MDAPPSWDCPWRRMPDADGGDPAIRLVVVLALTLCHFVLQEVGQMWGGATTVDHLTNIMANNNENLNCGVVGVLWCLREKRNVR